MLNRNSKTTIASRSVGMNGSKISRMFEGRCVKTIVLTSPTRDASTNEKSLVGSSKMTQI
jgi:hypothetical protein